MNPISPIELLNKLAKIPGGYEYAGVVSCQVCFPLKTGGELRFGIYEDDNGPGCSFDIDLYGGELPPGITGPAWKTGATTTP